MIAALHQRGNGIATAALSPVLPLIGVFRARAGARWRPGFGSFVVAYAGFVWIAWTAWEQRA